jgi:hypothetical protein
MRESLLSVLLILLMMGCARANRADIIEPCKDRDGNPCSAPADWDAVQYLANYADLAKDAGARKNPLWHWCKYGQYEGRSYKKLSGTPRQNGEIVNFNLISEATIPLSAYFSARKINGILHAGTYGYQNGKHDSKLYKFTPARELVQSLNAESVFCIEQFKKIGKWFMSVEQGEFDTTGGRAMIYALEDNGWVKKYVHPRWDLMLNMIEHDGYLWATGWKFGSEDTGIVRSADGDNWEEYWSNKAGHIPWMPIIHNGELWWAGAVGGSGGGWGKYGVLLKVVGGSEKVATVYSDHARMGTAPYGMGFWAGCSFKGNIYVGTAGEKVFVGKYENGAVNPVWSIDWPNSVIHWMGVSPDGQTMIVAVCNGSNGNGNGIVLKTKDGKNYTQLPAFSQTRFFIHGSWEDDGLYLPAGKFDQRSDGYGQILKSVTE